jgi:predicted short-subunit dehydrogenase-like oxidoreductase (DUF2520 family)
LKISNPIQKISFIGSGNVSTHLAVAFKMKGFNIAEVYSPNLMHAEQFCVLTGGQAVENLSDIDTDTDLILIAVPDDKIEEVFHKLPVKKGIIAHTSGFTSIKVFSGSENYGVFYPLQTFTKGKTLDFSDVPFCIEANNPTTENRLQALAGTVSDHVLLINSEDRKYLHLAAVMVNNFANHIYSIADDILQTKHIDFKLLLPLIRETANKMYYLKPGNSQTGPAHRNDISTLEDHEKMLNNWPEYKKLYHLITTQIIKKYNG